MVLICMPNTVVLQEYSKLLTSKSGIIVSHYYLWKTKLGENSPEFLDDDLR